MNEDRQKDRKASEQEAATGGWLTKLSSLDAVVVARPDDDLKNLLKELHALKIHTRHIWPMPGIMPQATDLLICDYTPDLTRCFTWFPGTPPMALMVLVRQNESVDIDKLASMVPDAVLALPTAPVAARANVMMAVNQFRFGQRLRAKVERLEENIRSFRLIERAKTIIMAQKQIDDASAYQAIRQRAMDKRVSVAVIAAAIIDSSELLG